MADGYIVGFSQQRAADVNYLSQLDQMRRQQAQLELDKKRQAAQERQFGQELSFRQQEAEARNQLAQDQADAQQSGMQQEAMLAAGQRMDKSMRDMRDKSHVSTQDMALIAQQQRQAGARNALKDELARGGDTEAIGKAILPYDQAGGLGFIKASMDDKRQANADARALQLHEHQRRMEEQGKWAYDPKRGMSVNAVTGQARNISNDGVDIGTTDVEKKPLPTSIAKDLFELRANNRKVDNALTEIKAYPDAVNRYGPDWLTQRIDPKGVSARGAIADIGSMVIHDRSGAAVTASETPRLRPFIPSITDNHETVVKKLENFKRVYQEMQDDIEGYHAESYRIPKPLSSEKQTQEAPANQKQWSATYKSKASAVQDGLDAIKKGASRESVIKRLREIGVEYAGI